MLPAAVGKVDITKKHLLQCTVLPPGTAQIGPIPFAAGEAAVLPIGGGEPAVLQEAVCEGAAVKGGGGEVAVPELAGLEPAVPKVQAGAVQVRGGFLGKGAAGEEVSGVQMCIRDRCTASPTSSRTGTWCSWPSEHAQKRTPARAFFFACGYRDPSGRLGRLGVTQTPPPPIAGTLRGVRHGAP